MDSVLYVIKMVIYVAVSALQLAMLVRAIMSWFPIGEGRFGDFLFSITEPFIEPVRIIIEKLGLDGGLPIDISFLITFMILSLVQTVLRMFL